MYKSLTGLEYKQLYLETYNWEEKQVEKKIHVERLSNGEQSVEQAEKADFLSLLVHCSRNSKEEKSKHKKKQVRTRWKEDSQSGKAKVLIEGKMAYDNLYIVVELAQNTFPSIKIIF